MTVIPQCFTCKHFDRGQPRGVYQCAAFPAGIPTQILYAEADHTRPYPGDNGIRYEHDPAAVKPSINPLEGFDFP